MPTELGRVAALPDVVLMDHFDLIIPNVPGGGDSEGLTIQNMSAVLPGRANAAIPIELHRHRIHQPGKRTYGHSFQAQFVDTAERKVINALSAWQDRITDRVTGLPRPKADSMTTAVARIYNADNSAYEERTMYGFFVTNVPDIALNGSSNSPAIFAVTFNYDYWLPKGL